MVITINIYTYAQTYSRTSYDKIDIKHVVNCEFDLKWCTFKYGY